MSDSPERKRRKKRERACGRGPGHPLAYYDEIISRFCKDWEKASRDADSYTQSIDKMLGVTDDDKVPG